MILFAADLDNTMIYSYKRPLTDRVLVEEKDGKPLSYMTEYSYSQMKSLSEDICFTPVTTRSLEQYRRIRLPGQEAPEYALAANGGILLRKGEIDQSWYENARALTKEADGELSRARRVLEKDTHLTLDIRMVDELFLFTKSGRKEETMAALNEALDQERVDIHSNGQKIYVIPKRLNKGAMTRRLKEQLGYPYTIGCGDSLFDIPMLMEADLSIFPATLNFGALAEHKENKVISEHRILSDAVFSCLEDLKQREADFRR